LLTLTEAFISAEADAPAPDSPLAGLVNAVGGWKAAATKTSDAFRERIEDVVSDLQALLRERHERYKSGQSTADTERAIQNLLKADLIATLAKRGFLPRYAFPLDVVELVTKEDRYAESDVELNRDRGLAIAEYAPGAQVVARKTLYTSGGLAFSSRKEMPDPEWF
jgi:hypothetical protein